MDTVEPYSGFEQGPIRPPSESDSLLVRVTRNCPWNRCTFCGLYKGERFSRRPVVHVLRDLDAVHRFYTALIPGEGNRVPDETAAPGLALQPGEEMAYYAARNWLLAGAESVFLQDSNSLIVHPDDLVRILRHLRTLFPSIKRITSYARSQTIARLDDEQLHRLAAAGLNRIHIGLESGCGQVLAYVKKGADRQTHILAGLKVKRAGIELSEYYMPGLGGRAWSRAHALESAEALNQINPDFIRLRTLALPNMLELAQDAEVGRFEPLGDVAIASELLLFLEALNGITSQVKSDHILNLFEEIDGILPQDKVAMLAVIRRFLAWDPQEQVLYQIGRRCGVFRCLDDCADLVRRRRALHYVEQFGANPETVDRLTASLVQRFI